LLTAISDLSIPTSPLSLIPHIHKTHHNPPQQPIPYYRTNSYTLFARITITKAGLAFAPGKIHIKSLFKLHPPQSSPSPISKVTMEDGNSTEKNLTSNYPDNYRHYQYKNVFSVLKMTSTQSCSDRREDTGVGSLGSVPFGHPSFQQPKARRLRQ
jgi:hypothetical protein